jgi:predicted ATPase
VAYQSEIRKSQINALLEKVEKKSYGKYVHKVILQKLRGFRGETVIFDFPVTAIVGPNGGGKTTILGAAACIYQEVKPRQFFAKSGKFDQSMADWSVEYELVDRVKNAKDAFKKTVSFRRSKWDRGALNREVVVFGVARTVPANERAELRKCASSSFQIDDKRIQKLQKEVATAVGRILGKDVSEFSHASVDSRGRVTLLAGSAGGVRYSEFHFGAGESSVIRMVMKIEQLAENSLILIEEIENGLHPIATVRMVEYLIDVAQRKRSQAIFTTHSNDALLPLPPKAIWAAINNKIVQGKLDIRALRAITGQIDAKLVIFVEDEFANTWMSAALRAYGGVAVDLIEIHAMMGDGMAVTINRNHNLDPSAKHLPSVCFIDGDSQQKESNTDRVYRLPGQTPESHVYDTVLDKLSNELIGILSVSLHRKYEEQDLVKRVVEEVRRTTIDPHNLFSQVGKQLGLIPEATVRGGFLSVWAQAYPEVVKELLDPIRDLLPMEADYQTPPEPPPEPPPETPPSPPGPPEQLDLLR